MTTFANLGSMAQAFTTAAFAHQAALPGAATLAAMAVRARAQKIFGDKSKLAPLAPYTQQERVKLGYTPDQPLLRSGKLRASLEIAVEGTTAGCGSSDPLLRIHELGSDRFPPRPVLPRALEEARPDIDAIIQAFLGGTFSVSMGMGQGINAWASFGPRFALARDFMTAELDVYSGMLSHFHPMPSGGDALNEEVNAYFHRYGDARTF